MSETKKPTPPGRQKAFNLVLAGVISQVGLLTLAVIIIAILAGLWLDNLLGTGALFTILLVVVSFPISVVGKLWIVRRAADQMKPVVPPDPEQEEISEEAADRGTEDQEG